MILGRNAGLWAGLVQAGLNLVAAFYVVIAGHDLTAATAAVFTAANAFGAVLVALIANSSDQGTLPTFAPTTVERRSYAPNGSQLPPSPSPELARRRGDPPPGDGDGGSA